MKNRKTALKIISIVIIGVLAAFCNTSPAKPVHRGHQPANLPVPPPPEYVTQKTSFDKWSSRDIIEAFKEHGLEVTVTKGLAIGSPAAKESTIFLIPSYGKDIGSLVSSFDSEHAMNEAVMHYSKMNYNADTPAWWIYRKDNILVLISGKVPEEQAGKYEDVLNDM